MTTNYGDNAQQPSISSEAFVPDQLIAGNLKLVTDTVTLTGAAALLRGAVLGKTVASGSAVATAGSGNTGAGVMGAITVAADALPGSYLLKITKASSGAGDFELIGPNGQLVGIGAVAAAFNAGGLSFTLADGTPDFAVGDSFSIAVSATTKYKLSLAAATDGSAVPAAILADAADPSAADVRAPIYQMGEFNGNALSFGAGHSVATVKPPLRALGIFIKDAVSAADPT